MTAYRAVAVALFAFSLVTAVSVAGDPLDAPRPLPLDNSVDLAPFGAATPWSGDREWGLAVEWKERRDVYAVVAEFKEGDPLPRPEDQRVEYWFSKWPNEGGGGWKLLDDPWNGKWLAVHADVEQNGNTFVYRFRPLSKEENPEAKSLSFPYRRTLKIRLAVSSGSHPTRPSTRSNRATSTSSPTRTSPRCSERRKDEG